MMLLLLLLIKSRKGHLKTDNTTLFLFLFSLCVQTPVVVADSRKADQKSVDDAILPAIKSVPLLDKYIKRSFTLTAGQKPHAIRF
jgi:hypothetical protein